MPTTPIQLDKRVPQSLINHAQGDFFNRLSELDPDVLDLDMAELARNSFPTGGVNSIPAKIFHLRFSLDRELAAVQDFPARMIDIDDVVNGICSRRHFFTLIKDKYIFAMILTPPGEYAAPMEEVLSLGISEMRRIMLLPDYIDPMSGMIDSRLLGIKFKIFSYADSRMRGSVVQRTETKSLNVNIETTAEEVKKIMSVEEIDKRLAELEAIAKEPMCLPPARDILAVERLVSDSGGNHTELIPAEANNIGIEE